MPCINNCSFVGTAVRDPELRYTPSNTAICTVGMALNSSWKDANGEKREEVAFIDLDAWGKLGEIVNQYLRKGEKFAVTAKVRQETWQDKEGNKRSKIKFTIQDFMLLGEKRQGGDSQPQPQQRPSTSKPAPLTGAGAFQPIDDDSVPFAHDAWQF